MQSITLVATFMLSLAWASPHHTDCTVGQTVNTTSGPVIGHAATIFPYVSEYLGIPFAQPPIGDLRFAGPLAYTGSSVLNGSTYVGPSG
jgi:hypothetical protein